MSSTQEIQERTGSAQTMLCPCCGTMILCSTPQCGCGARFVGAPLDETPLKVQRFGPAMTSVALLMIVIGAALVATKWFAFGGVLVIWSSWRSVRLAKRDPEWYGGFKTAAATLTVAIVGSAALAAYGIAYIPRAIDNYWIRQAATTRAAMYHVANLLEEYKVTNNGGYPRNAQEFKKLIGESLPSDYWGASVKYQSKIGDIAEQKESIENTGLPLNHFELRSAGPDGILGTDDDIVMLDGMFFTDSEAKKQAAIQHLR